MFKCCVFFQMFTSTSLYATQSVLVGLLTEMHTGPRPQMKASSSHKGPYEFDQLLFVQDFKSEHIGPVWCMKFSACGRLELTVHWWFSVLLEEKAVGEIGPEPLTLTNEQRYKDVMPTSWCPRCLSVYTFACSFTVLMPPVQ